MAQAGYRENTKTPSICAQKTMLSDCQRTSIKNTADQKGDSKTNGEYSNWGISGHTMSWNLTGYHQQPTNRPKRINIVRYVTREPQAWTTTLIFSNTQKRLSFCNRKSRTYPITFSISNSTVNCTEYLITHWNRLREASDTQQLVCNVTLTTDNSKPRWKLSNDNQLNSASNKY